ncbi:MAG: hypothetical protein JEZ09_21760 [Salinivirgaceae bacterium]|nr:hypothetical protein [Salinivirgaceae bacterium]MBI9069932.1 hypothetical protein [Salinivirgaceae bacterium]
MMRLINELSMNRLIVLALGLIFITSCGPKEYKKIPLENLDPKLKSKGGLIVKDILTSINHEEGARFLLSKDYVTPMVHGRIMHNQDSYNESYMLIPMAIGKVSKYSLFQVVDKGLIKTMRYKLVTDATDMKFIELKIDINIDYGLADFYLYLTSNDGAFKRQNILPQAVK